MSELKAARLAKKWSQDKLADESGVSRVRIGQIENGSEPGITIAHKLSDALRVPTRKLWPVEGESAKADRKKGAR
jgi:transcriptional regulator with XRE-family HTH domain